MNNNEIIAVVVTYNRLSMLQKCIDALFKQTIQCDVLVVNNASTDQTAAWLEKEQNQNLYVLNNETNLGGAGGFNYGMKWAVEQGYRFAWLMDDDCFPKRNALEKLLEADNLLDGNYGWLSSVALWTDGQECRMNRQKLKKSYYNYIPFLEYGIIQAEQATFVSLFLKTETIANVGLPIKEFFIWGDDIEYTRRISVRNEFSCFVVGQSQVVHAMKNNVGSSLAEDKPERINRYQYAYRNEAYLYRKEGFSGICFFLARCGLHLCHIMIRAPGQRGKRIWILITSMIRGLVFNPQIESIL